MIRTAIASVIALLTLTSSVNDHRTGHAQSRGVRELVSDLAASDPITRARAACEMRDLGDAAVEAIQPLVGMLGDAAPVESNVCGRQWWHGNATDLTTPGEQAAAVLVAIGTRAFQPVLNALQGPSWSARRNAAWALGAFDDQRAVTGDRKSVV